MLRHDYPGQVCSIAGSLEVIGERWSLLIIRDILRGKNGDGNFVFITDSIKQQELVEQLKATF